MPSSDPHNSELFQLLVLAREAHAQWQALNARKHASQATTNAEHGVLEILARNGAQSVPAISRARFVSRQHIQKRADALVEKGLADFADNPAHKSSKLLEATIAGERAHATASRGEADVLQQLLGKIDPKDIATARAVFSTLAKAVEQHV